MTHDLVIFTAIGTLAMLVQSFFGFAGSLTAIPLFSLFFSVREVLPAYTLIMIVIDIWLVFEARHHVQWGKAAQLLPPACIASPIGAIGLKFLPIHTIHLAVSFVTCTFAVLFLLRIKFTLQESAKTQMCVGFLSGFLQGCIGQAGPPMVIYGTARKWDKNTFRSTLLMFFLCLFPTSVVSYALLGLYSRHSGTLFLAGVIPAALAANIGVRLKDKVSDASFRQAILFVVLSVGVVSLVRVFG